MTTVPSDENRNNAVKRLVGMSAMLNDLCLQAGILHDEQEVREQFTLDILALNTIGVTEDEIAAVAQS